MTDHSPAARPRFRGRLAALVATALRAALVATALLAALQRTSSDSPRSATEGAKISPEPEPSPEPSPEQPPGQNPSVATPPPAAPAARAEDPPEPREAKVTFLSGGKEITVERYEPAAKGKYPAILLLPAIDGLREPLGTFYRAAARRYAGKGYVVVLVNYFDRTGTAEAQMKCLRKPFFRRAKGTATEADNKVLDAPFRAWMDTVADAVRYARTLPNVDEKRVGVVGFSLGAYLALAAAAEKDLQLCAVVDLFGGLPKEMRAGAKNLPPTLIIHGDADPVVPVTEAYKLSRLLKKAKRPYELKVYQEAGHLFIDPPEEEDQETAPVALKDLLRINTEQMKDADERTAAFLEKHLKAAPPTGEAEQKAER
jgi:carboxymethylenebutenolidase